MTLDNLQYALYLNNCILLDKIKAIKEAVNGVVSTDIEELKKLVDDINNNELTNINQLITDLDTDLSNHTSDTAIHVTQDDKDLWNATLQNAKDYAKKLFDSVTSFTIEIVDALPTKDIKTMTIYFMRNGRDNESDYYEEYMYINNKWEIIGSTFVNLAPYVLKEDFEKYQQEITDKFLKYNTSDEIVNILKEYLLTQTFNDTIKNYTTTEALQELLKKYAKIEDTHTHKNKDLLDKLSESTGGNLLFDGQEIKGGSGSDITISKKENNAIQQKDDGIFVEDKTDIINKIQEKTNQISIAQKTINNELDYCLHHCIEYSDFKFSIGTLIPFENKINSKNIEYNSSTHTFKLKANKTYKIQCFIRGIYSSGYIYYNIINITDSIVYSVNGCIETYQDSVTYSTNENNNIETYQDSNTTLMPTETIIETNKDIDIGIQITNNNENSIIGLLSSSSRICIQEIGRMQTIDPVEYINITNGIEDTPVGHIISYMGNTAPKHYLICDGTKYNISDYPYLAEHFKTEFSSYNYFGGNGTTTFAVPDLRGEFLRGAGTNSHTNQGSGANVGKHQDATEVREIAESSAANNVVVRYNNSTSLRNAENKDSITVQETRYIRLTGTSTSHSGEAALYTSRPTNTSVLYCIKYEPTYYMNVTQTISLEEAELLKQQNELLQKEINSLNAIIDSINRAVI